MVRRETARVLKVKRRADRRRALRRVNNRGTTVNISVIGHIGVVSARKTEIIFTPDVA